MVWPPHVLPVFDGWHHPFLQGFIICLTEGFLSLENIGNWKQYICFDSFWTLKCVLGLYLLFISWYGPQPEKFGDPCFVAQRICHFGMKIGCSPFCVTKDDSHIHLTMRNFVPIDWQDSFAKEWNGKQGKKWSWDPLPVKAPFNSWGKMLWIYNFSGKMCQIRRLCFFALQLNFYNVFSLTVLYLVMLEYFIPQLFEFDLEKW